jgi:hypothetical protein
MSTGRVLGPRNVMSDGCVVRTRTASGISMTVVITIFRFGMGCKTGGEMPISRAFGPRDVMSDGCVVKNLCCSGISVIVIITILGSERRQQTVITYFLWRIVVSCPGFVCSLSVSDDWVVGGDVS